MVTLSDLLAEIVQALDAAGVPHMIAGSLASTLHGEPRSTQDIDLVIDPAPDQLTTFADRQVDLIVRKPLIRRGREQVGLWSSPFSATPESTYGRTAIPAGDASAPRWARSSRWTNRSLSEAGAETTNG